MLVDQTTLMNNLDRRGKIRRLDPETINLYVANSAGEMYFWHNYFRTKGGSQWSRDYAKLAKGEFNVPKWVDPHVEELDPLSARVLDIGSGPISCLEGAKSAYGLVNLTAIDPFASGYNSILGLRKFTTTRISWGLAEDLSAVASFSQDLVVAQNSLDHSFDPVRGLIKMLGVVREGGKLVLGHIENEGERENYEGLHFWNFTEVNGDFIVWNPEYEVNVSDEFKDVASFECDRFQDGTGRTWIRVVCQPQVRLTAATQRDDWAWGVVEASMSAMILQQVHIFSSLTPRWNPWYETGDLSWKRRMRMRFHELLP